MSGSGQDVLKLLSWNVNGLKNKDRTNGVLREIKDSHVVFLQETHIGPDDTGVLHELEDFKKYFTKYNGYSRGVAILIRETVAWEDVWQVEDPEGRSLILTGKLRGQLYTFVNVYNPSNDTDLLNKLILEHDLGVLVIGGDFNTALNPQLDRGGRKINPRHNALRPCVKRFMKRFNLVDIWRVKNLKKRDYTFKVLSRLDYFFMQEVNFHLVQHCAIKNIGISDHDPVCLNLARNDLSKKDVSLDSKGWESVHAAESLRTAAESLRTAA
ncbi:hypothetical protein COCON_G00129700, partial [Conger conger]